MFAESQHAALSEYIAQFIEKAKNPQSDLKQIEIPPSLNAYANALGLKFKSSFGFGARSHMPWLACFGKGQSASVEGVYPVLIFRTDTNQLYVTYGVSETADTKVGHWPTQWPSDTTENLPPFPYEKYESARFLKQYDCSEGVNLQEITDNFLTIVNLFLEMLAQVTPSIEKLKAAKMDAMPQQLHESMRHVGLTFSEDQIKRLLAAQATKPFVILTGLSGSGKTKLAEAIAYWLSADADKQVCIVAVGADWTNNEPLLGYADAINVNQKRYCAPASGILQLLQHAVDNENKPHFLILDEMNLSHVERYFADFLSAMESSKPELALHGQGMLNADGMEVPARQALQPNVFIIGTVNVDETTYMFSPKVLDRANVIEFRVSADQMRAFLAAPETAVSVKALEGEGAHYAEAFVARAKLETTLDGRMLHGTDEADGANGTGDTGNTPVSVLAQLQKDLMELFEPLAEVGAEFGYRSAKEIARFVAIHRELSGDGWQYQDALDAQVLQKLMPKLHGSERKLSGVLRSLEKFAKEKGLPLTKNKVERMLQRLKDEGFTSFAEN
jgi:5-methylcytosine-specific restriction protein B